MLLHELHHEICLLLHGLHEGVLDVCHLGSELGHLCLDLSHLSLSLGDAILHSLDLLHDLLHWGLCTCWWWSKCLSGVLVSGVLVSRVARGRWAMGLIMRSSCNRFT